MATISITRDIILTEDDMKVINESAPTDLFMSAIAPTVNRINSQPKESSKGKFGTYLR